VNYARAIHGQGRDNPAAHEVKDDFAQPALKNMGPHPQDHWSLGMEGSNDGCDHRAHIPSKQDPGKPVQELREGRAGEGRASELIRSHFALAIPQRHSAYPRQIDGLVARHAS
jgi:hypothetical protein